MGIFSEADRHPFHEVESVRSKEDARGGVSGQNWGEDRRVSDFVRSTERPRGLYIRDDNPAALLS